MISGPLSTKHAGANWTGELGRSTILAAANLFSSRHGLGIRTIRRALSSRSVRNAIVPGLPVSRNKATRGDPESSRRRAQADLLLLTGEAFSSVASNSLALSGVGTAFLNTMS